MWGTFACAQQIALTVWNGVVLGSPHHDMHALRRECQWGVCIVRSAADSVPCICFNGRYGSRSYYQHNLNYRTAVAIASQRWSVGHQNFLAPLYIVCRSMILGEELDLLACSDTCRKSYIPA